MRCHEGQTTITQKYSALWPKMINLIRIRGAAAACQAQRSQHILWALE